MSDTLITLLNQTNLNLENQALYQLLKELINRQPVTTVSDPNVEVYNVDTRVAPVTIPLITAVKPGKFYIISDIFGNASVNNITIAGVVDGVTDPVINTDYGTFRVYGNTAGYSTW